MSLYPVSPPYHESAPASSPRARRWGTALLHGVCLLLVWVPVAVLGALLCLVVWWGIPVLAVILWMVYGLTRLVPGMIHQEYAPLAVIAVLCVVLFGWPIAFTLTRGLLVGLLGLVGLSFSRLPTEPGTSSPQETSPWVQQRTIRRRVLLSGADALAHLPTVDGQALDTVVLEETIIEEQGPAPVQTSSGRPWEPRRPLA